MRGFYSNHAPLPHIISSFASCMDMDMDMVDMDMDMDMHNCTWLTIPPHYPSNHSRSRNPAVSITLALATLLSITLSLLVPCSLTGGVSPATPNLTCRSPSTAAPTAVTAEVEGLSRGRGSCLRFVGTPGGRGRRVARGAVGLTSQCARPIGHQQALTDLKEPHQGSPQRSGTMVCVAEGPEEVGQWPPGFREDSDWLAFLSLSSSTNVHGPTHGHLGLLFEHGHSVQRLLSWEFW